MIFGQVGNALLLRIKTQSGVTLIELLVVIVLLGIAIALVGPFTMKLIESSQARNEQLLLQRWVQKQALNAFTRDSAILLRFDGKAVYSNLLPDTLSYNGEANEINGVETMRRIDLNVYLADDQRLHSKIINDPEPDILFNHLFFEPKLLKINNHGYINVEAFSYHYKGVETSLNISNLLARTHVK